MRSPLYQQIALALLERVVVLRDDRRTKPAVGFEPTTLALRMRCSAN